MRLDNEIHSIRSRAYGLGFSFFWTVFFIGIHPLADSPNASGVFYLSNSIFTIIGLILLSVLDQKVQEREFIVCFAPGVVFLTGILLYHYFPESIIFSVVAGMLVGISCACYMAFWQDYYARCEPNDSAVIIPISASLSAILVIAITLWLPVSMNVQCYTVLLFVSSTCLFYARRNSAPQANLHWGKKEFDALKTAFWKPVFCVCSIGFAWQLMASIDPTNTLIFVSVNLGVFFGALLLICSSVLSKWRIERIFQALFLPITAAFLIVAVFGFRFTPLAAGMLMMGFEILNLLLITLCATYANQHKLLAISVYALCITPTLGIMAIGHAVGIIGSESVLKDIQSATAFLFLGIYVLSSGLYVASKTKSATSHPVLHFDEDGMLPDAGPEIKPLTPREAEIAELVIRGNNVPAIAKELVISENTVRSHMKHIYEKLNIHSRQELIELTKSDK